MILEQYTIVIVNLDPTIGKEIRKTRPCVIVSPDEMNRHLGTVVVAPITSSKNPYPTRIPVKVGRSKSQIAIDQIRTIDRRRVYKIKGPLKPEEIKQVKKVIRMTFVD